MARLLVNIDVRDLAAAEAFYTRAFALHPGRRFGEAGVELLGLEAPLYLLEKAEGSTPFDGAPAGRTYAPHWTPVHIDVAVDDLDAAITRAEEAGASCEGPVREAAWGRIQLLRDPFGHGFCLLQFSELGYDAVATSRR